MPGQALGSLGEPAGGRGASVVNLTRVGFTTSEVFSRGTFITVTGEGIRTVQYIDNMSSIATSLNCYFTIEQYPSGRRVRSALYGASGPGTRLKIVLIVGGCHGKLKTGPQLSGSGQGRTRTWTGRVSLSPTPEKWNASFPAFTLTGATYR
jgi:hypothetical protein